MLFRSDTSTAYTTSVSASRRLRIDGNASNLELIGLKGIKFQATQNYSTDANVLDDYEEGSYDPAITTSGTAPTLTYAYRRGEYVKVGRLVSFHALVSATWSNSPTGQVYISLPFPSTAIAGNYPTVSIGYHNSLISYGSGKTYVEIGRAHV